MQAEMPSEDWFQQVNGLLDAAIVVDQPRPNTLNLINGIYCYYVSLLLLISSFGAFKVNQ